MRTAALIIAAAAAFTLSACNKPAEDKTEASTEAAEASGAAVDTAATSADGSAGGTASAGNAGGSASGSRASTGGQTMAPASGATLSDGATAPNAQTPAGAGTTVTETERRLNPPQNNAPAQ